ncbi:hypothetical protein SDC9_169605 [bioreactor metagenome]|uniref:Uncharacterized protein n=1 Tax=bioreactor metagenome TaxID=1076179 RepID=A0A645G8C9_9ZZZZ
MPIFWRILYFSSSSFVSIPQTVTLPLSGTLIAFVSFASVDFPEPLCPRIATSSPLLTVKLISISDNSSGIFSSSLSYLKFTFSKTIKFSAINIPISSILRTHHMAIQDHSASLSTQFLRWTVVRRILDKQQILKYRPSQQVIIPLCMN